MDGKSTTRSVKSLTQPFKSCCNVFHESNRQFICFAKLYTNTKVANHWWNGQGLVSLQWSCYRHIFPQIFNIQQLTVLLCCEFMNASTLESLFTIYSFLALKMAGATILYFHKKTFNHHLRHNHQFSKLTGNSYFTCLFLVELDMFIFSGVDSILYFQGLKMPRLSGSSFKNIFMVSQVPINAHLRYQSLTVL